jgi:UDP-2-acetamido-3-amino-2,3-dideoxy-glucuronate N-acetyltransferase
MVFTNDKNPRSECVHDYLPTLVQYGATLGANSTIICGHTIGRYAFVAAGAIITSNVPDYALMVGTPAKHCGWVCKCSTRLYFDGSITVCHKCGTKFTWVSNIVTEIV